MIVFGFYVNSLLHFVPKLISGLIIGTCLLCPIISVCNRVSISGAEDDQFLCFDAVQSVREPVFQSTGSSRVYFTAEVLSSGCQDDPTA